MRTEFLNEAADIEWLLDTHLAGLPYPVPPFQSFVIVGNDDAPAKLQLYTSHDPLYTDSYLQITYRDDMPPLITYERTVVGAPLFLFPML